MNNEIYEKNINFLRTRCPSIYDDLVRIEKNIDDRPDVRIEIEVLEGRRGFPTFKVYPRNGKTITGHSVFDPNKDAEKRYSDNDFFKENTRIIVIGFGFGYEVRYLLSRIKHPVIVVLEPYVSVFRKALENVDITDIFSTGRVILSFAVTPEELKYTLTSNLTHINLPDFKISILPHISAFPEIHDITKKAIELSKTYLTFNLYTGMISGPIFQNNIAMNFSIAIKHPGVSMLEGCFDKKPVIIVAPGPSLEKNVKQLERAKGKALILACDTATKPMLRHGVEPDCIISIDYQAANFFKIRGIDTSFAYFIPAMELTPFSPKNHGGRMFNYYHSGISESLFSDVLGSKGIITTGGSVLTDAFNFARQMRADPIILVGVDLGFPGMKWYADGSFDDGKFSQDLEDGKHEIVEVEDIYGKPLCTYKSFLEFIHWFNLRIPRMKTEVIDATEGGAKLDDALIMTLSDAIDKYVDHIEENPRDVLDAVYESYVPPDTDMVIEKLTGYINTFKELEDTVSKGIKSCNRAIDILERSKAMQNNKELIRLLKRINDSKKVLKNTNKQGPLNFLAPMLERQMAHIFYSEEDDTLPRNERYKNLVELDKNLYDKINKACANMRIHFTMVKEELELERDEEFV